MKEFYKKHSLAFIFGIATAAWQDIICNGFEFNIHHHNWIAGFLGFAFVGLLAIPRTLLMDVVQTDNIVAANSSHKVCCDCEDPELHEEALQEIENYLNQ